jgi:hypothetical protein
MEVLGRTSPDFSDEYGTGLDFEADDWETDDWKSELVDFFGELGESWAMCGLLCVYFGLLALGVL